MARATWAAELVSMIVDYIWGDEMQTVAVLGSTGAIGTRTLEVIKALGDAVRVPVLVAGHNMVLLADQIKLFEPELVGVADEEASRELLGLLGSKNKPAIVVGDEGLNVCAEYPTDVLVNAVMGARGIMPALIAVRRGARLALANKECLVAAGSFIMAEAEAAHAEIVPVDSEHCALFQALLGGTPSEVERFILTASGGPFRLLDPEKLQQVTVEDALQHPNWSMGKKITVDSATMMNKGLEVIEAHHLFAAPYDKIEVLVHPQSIVHSMIEYVDGSVMAQLATHDMRLPIQYALTYPERVSLPWPRLDFKTYNQLTFEEPNTDKFPALKLAVQAGCRGGYAPCVLNAANEVAVDAFLSGVISFVEISQTVESTLEALGSGSPTSVDDVIAMDGQARDRARAILMKGG
ncbi:1-deoxy-D-xylulose-5-phosphate reductoisomerase [Alicyclobacillus dauci]|uniref:1-deoxy-D-xylulose 5-phosphate reductoisomerase n=1 Tax=Alicyclobacillus dauci TaxID=1475485 RepID=A0ABY6YXP5_9BACL|nr:1-deoxy-D-xylulose-5-phosphate reductoisomerase [Alicyclobacillus dauci]WAH35374.1 1-deoxy-D-xylulose-5-phosphate reductoisomerase [Alicyclobacillus dauci]